MATKYFISGGPGEFDLLIALGRQEEVVFTLGLIDENTGYEKDAKGEGRFLAEASITALKVLKARTPPVIVEGERITRMHNRVIWWQIEGIVNLGQELKLFTAEYGMIDRTGTMVMVEK